MKVKLKQHTPDLELVIAREAGICYDSNVTNPKQLVKRLKADGHLATFRFAHVTFQVSDFSRTCSMQMLRHAFLDYLQRSQRYCKEFQFEYVTPPSIKNSEELVCHPNDMAECSLVSPKELYDQLMYQIQLVYDTLERTKGIKAEDARYVLPNSCYTKMNITGNVQAWWDFLYGNAGRLQKAAQWEVREVAVEIEKQLAEIAPNIFGGAK